MDITTPAFEEDLPHLLNDPLEGALSNCGPLVPKHHFWLLNSFIFLELFRWCLNFEADFSHFRKQLAGIFRYLEASPWPPSHVPQAFARYQLDGEIHVDELKGALVMCSSDWATLEHHRPSTMVHSRNITYHRREFQEYPGFSIGSIHFSSLFLGAFGSIESWLEPAWQILISAFPGSGQTFWPSHDCH